MSDGPEAPPAVVDAIRDGVVVVGGDDRVHSVNAAVERALGIDRGTVVGAPLGTLFSAGGIAPREAAEVRRAITEVRTDGGAKEVEVTYTDDAGDERVGTVWLTALAGGPAVAGIVRDVTERREHDRVLSSLHGVTRRLVRADEPREICAIAVHAGSDLLDLPISGVWLADDDRGGLEPVASTAGAHDEFGGLPRFAPGDGLVWDAFESGEIERYGDLREVDGLYNPDTPLRSEIIAPIGEYGVLMTGSFEPHAFDEADLDLFSTLVENTRAALDRAERDRLLRERADRIASQADRLETVATALSTDIDRELEGIEAALDGEASGEVPPEERIDRIREFVADVREVAENATDVGRRERVELGAALEAAVAESRADPDRVVLEDGWSLRAAPGRLRSLLESVLDHAAGQVAGAIRTVRAGIVDGDERGFYVATDGGSGDRREGDERAGDGLDLAVARAIAEAHGWRLSAGDGRVRVRGVTTLER